MPSLNAVRPWHLLPIALVLVFWHAALSFDYLNHRFDLVQDTPSLLAVLAPGPIWARVAWALAVWLGLAGASFLLFADDAAVLLVFSASVAMIVALSAVFLAGAPQQVWGLPWWGLSGALAVVPLAGWLYARGLKRRGVLR